MQKLFGIVVIVLGAWLGMEVYTKGTHEALGGIFARFSDAPAPGVGRQSSLEHIEQSGLDARERQLGRIEDQLGSPPRDSHD